MSEPKPPMPPLRALVINLMLSLLISVSVFVVISQLYIIPAIAGQQLQIQALHAELNAIKAEMEDEEDEAPAAAPVAAPAAPATAPAAAAPATAPAAVPKK